MFFYRKGAKPQRSRAIFFEKICIRKFFEVLSAFTGKSAKICDLAGGKITKA